MEENATMEPVTVLQDSKADTANKNLVSMTAQDMVYAKIILAYVKKITSELIAL